MSEEQVTRALLKWLIGHQWEIVSFDFPQSGTGRVLHPNTASGHKNKDSIIPDIVAVKNEFCVFSENKDRYYYPDFMKQHGLIIENDYSDAIFSLLGKRAVRYIYYGIGLPAGKHQLRAKSSAELVDFILCVGRNMEVEIEHNPFAIPF